MPEKRRADSVVVNIYDKFKNLSSTPLMPSMFRVGDNLRSINPKAYDPQIIAIGPFHRSKPNLQNMEQHKVRYLELFLRRRKERSILKSYVYTIRGLQYTARKCYAEDIQLDEDEFVEMLILDGCFIIEFLYMFNHREHREVDDPIFQYEYIRSQLLDDLMVFENQIPFFIIEGLFNKTKINNEDNVNSLIWPLQQNGIFPVQDLPEVPSNSHHLLGIVHHNQCSSFARIFSHSGDPYDVVSINSAVELNEAGISFTKSEGDNFLHIEFKNKEVIIPEWQISDSTESLFRNLIAYEYYNRDIPQKYVTDYVFFMYCLVRSPEDAKLLRRSGIISNLLGSDEMVYHLINQLVKNIIISETFSYSNIFNRANEHYAKSWKRWNRWMTTLKREYFNNPWTTNSVIAAIVLLVLTIIQATFAILSYRNDLKKGN